MPLIELFFIYFHTFFVSTFADSKWYMQFYPAKNIIHLVSYHSFNVQGNEKYAEDLCFLLLKHKLGVTKKIVLLPLNIVFTEALKFSLNLLLCFNFFFPIFISILSLVNIFERRDLLHFTH